jgi:hypothetical protein
MSKQIRLHVGDTPKLEFTLGVDLTYAKLVYIKYYKPNDAFGYFVATVSDTNEGVVYYQVNNETEIDETGRWRFWVYIVFNDGSPLSYRPVYIDVYEPGKDYISHPFGGYTNVEGDSMPIEAFRVIYDNTNSGLSADDVQEAIDEVQTNINVLDFQKKITPYIVGKETNDPYSTIQSAINQAVTVDGKSFTDPAVIIVKPGTYTEDVTLYPGINVIALAWEKSYMTILNGMLIYDTSAGGTSGTKIATWTGIDVSAAGSPGTVRFAGLNPQRLHLLNCHITSTNTNPGLIMTNNSGDSLVIANDVDFENTSTGYAVRIDYGKLSSFKTRTLNSNVSIQVNNNSEIESFNNYSTGKLEFQDTVTGLVVNSIISNGINDCIIMDSSNPITFVNPVIVGTGNLVDVASTNPTNVVLKAKNQASEIIYDNTTSGLSAQTVQAAIDELAP